MTTFYCQYGTAYIDCTLNYYQALRTGSPLDNVNVRIMANKIIMKGIGHIDFFEFFGLYVDAKIMGNSGYNVGWMIFRQPESFSCI